MHHSALIPKRTSRLHLRRPFCETDGSWTPSRWSSSMPRGTCVSGPRESAPHS